MFRSWKLFLVLILVGINVFLLVRLRGNQAHLNQAFQTLIQSPVAMYFEDLNSGNSLRYAFDDRDRGAALGDASEVLTKAIVAIREHYVEDKVTLTSNSANTYFSSRMMIDPNLQKGLIHAFEEYQEKIVSVLQTDVAKNRSFRDSLAQSMKRELIDVETQFEASSPGTVQTKTLYVPLHRGTDYPMGFTIRGIHSGDSIQWEKDNNASLGYDDYVNLAIQFRQTARSPRLLQITNELNKMNSLLGDPGKVEVYGRVYSLSSITLGEIDSITKAMLLLQWRTNGDLIGLIHELSTITTQ